MSNTVVLDDVGIVNHAGLRSPDEFVRHKVLDLFGDLALLGARLQAHVVVERGGHSLHLEIVRALLETSRAARADAWHRLRSARRPPAAPPPPS